MRQTRVYFCMLRQVRLSFLCRAQFSTSVALSRPESHPINGGLTGSAKLFADAALEEADPESSTTLPRRVHDRLSEQPNWTGDERIEDAVLRMLVDKYKPLRTGTIETAEQKIHKYLPRVQEYHPDAPPINVASPPPPPLTDPPPGGSWAHVPLLPPGPPDHRPWHTEFKLPDHAKSSIKFASFPLLSHTPRTGDVDDLEQTRKNEKELNKKLGRLTRARESTLDYRLGLGSQGKRTGSRVNPVNIKGWTSLIEDRIEQARRAGLFASVKGRGKPITRAPEEFNPFIGREEFLMNRIVKRNGAAPPWVQLQAELDASLQTFRHLLLDGWTRHAVRTMTLNGIGSAGDVQAFRDPAWARREAAYHAAALAEVNECVRRYNALAPYAVRRPLYVLEAELAGVYARAVEDVARALEERSKPRETALRKQTLRATTSHKDPDWSWIRRLGDLLVAVVRRLARLVRVRTR